RQLDGEPEVRGRTVGPSGVGRERMRPVERRIDLDTAEDAPVALEVRAARLEPRRCRARNRPAGRSDPDWSVFHLHPLSRPHLPRMGRGVPVASDVAGLSVSNTSAMRDARFPVSAYAMFDATATTIPVSGRETSDITWPPARSPSKLSDLVAWAKRTRSDGVE